MLTCISAPAVFGPVATKWFGILQRHVVLGSVATATAARVAADQIVFAPIQLTCFLSSMAIMEGSDPVEKWKHAFGPAYKANLAVWPFVQGVNFAYVPLELRVLVVNVISLGGFSSLRVIVSVTNQAHRLELLPEYDEQQRGMKKIYMGSKLKAWICDTLLV